ncbi:MAG: TlpA disulfide reductase family protein [Candidatus Dormiibacterota bacterium]
MRSGRCLLLSVLVVVAFGVDGCSLQQSIANLPGSQVAGTTTAAAAIVGDSTTGSPVDITVLGGVTAVDFWGSWCGPCREEQPALNQLASLYRSRGVTFIGVDMDDDNDSANAYRSSYHVPYQSVADSTGSISAAYDVAAPPTLVVVNRSGRIVGRFLGTLVGAETTLNQALT